MKISKIISVIVITTLFSCQSKETKFINVEFSKIQATWKIENFSVEAPDSLKNILKKGEIVFYSSCKYDKKKFQNAESCGGEFQIDKFLFSVSYQYLYDKKLFPISLGLYNGDPNIINGRENPNQIKIIRLMEGQWEMTVVDDKLIAKQVKNNSASNIQVSFTAKRK